MRIFILLKELPFLKQGSIFYFGNYNEFFTINENGSKTIHIDNCFDFIKSYFFDDEFEDNEWIKEIK